MRRSGENSNMRSAFITRRKDGANSCAIVQIAWDTLCDGCV